MIRFYLFGLFVVIITSDCNVTSSQGNCIDSCQNLVSEAKIHYDKYDYKYVVNLPDSFTCCDTSSLQAMLWWKALAYLELKQLETSIEYFNRLIARDPENAEAFGTRGLAYELLGFPGAAMADYNRAIELNPDLLLERNNRAEIYRKQGQLNKAIEEFTYILGKDSTKFYAYYNRGLVFTMQGKYTNAIIDLKKALTLDTTDQLLLSLSSAELKANYPHDALKHIELAISMYPSNPQLYANRAYAYIALNNTNAACEDLQRLDDMGYISEDPILLDPCKNRKKKR